MKVEITVVCRLCLKICENGVKIMGNTQEIINSLLPNLEVAISKDPVLCEKCFDSLTKCFNFKTGFLHRQNRATFSAENEDVKTEVPKMCLSETAVVTGINSTCNNGKTCYFCMDLIKTDHHTFSGSQYVHLIVTLEKYFPELIANITEDSAACKSCYESVQHQVSFVSNCLNVEQKIQRYCKEEGTGSKSQVELSNVLYFTPKSTLLDNNSDNNQTIFRLAKCYGQVENDELEVKPEDVKVEEEELNIRKEEVKTEMEEDNSNSSEINLPNLLPSRASPMVTSKTVTKLHKCNMCDRQCKSKGNLRSHMLTHRNDSEITMYKCELCTFKTKRSDNLQRHLVTHKSTSEAVLHKCKICIYETKHKRNISRHMLLHKSTSEVTMYRCKMCTYQRKYKYDIQKHMLTRHNPLKEGVHKCYECPYETVQESQLQRHMLLHKSGMEVTLLNCELCFYQTKRRDNLRKHLLTHKSSSEVPAYNCTQCSYSSKYKETLQRHMLTHKSTSEVTMYKCEMCEFMTKYKRSIKRHMASQKHQYSNETTVAS